MHDADDREFQDLVEPDWSVEPDRPRPDLTKTIRAIADSPAPWIPGVNAHLIHEVARVLESVDAGVAAAMRTRRHLTDQYAALIAASTDPLAAADTPDGRFIAGQIAGIDLVFMNWTK